VGHVRGSTSAKPSLSSTVGCLAAMGTGVTTPRIAGTNGYDLHMRAAEPLGVR
jgi:hypothetical protein